VNAAEILREAAKEVDAHWGRGHLEHAGRLCAIGALRKAAFGDANVCNLYREVSSNRRSYETAVRALADAFQDQGFQDRMFRPGAHDFIVEIGIVHINDRCAKSRADVSRAMEKAAAKLEEHG
jgi:hypothetical protein